MYFTEIAQRRVKRIIKILISIFQRVSLSVLEQSILCMNLGLAGLVATKVIIDEECFCSLTDELTFQRTVFCINCVANVLEGIEWKVVQ